MKLKTLPGIGPYSTLKKKFNEEVSEKAGTNLVFSGEHHFSFGKMFKKFCEKINKIIESPKVDDRDEIPTCVPHVYPPVIAIPMKQKTALLKQVMIKTVFPQVPPRRTNTLEASQLSSYQAHRQMTRMEFLSKLQNIFQNYYLPSESSTKSY